MLIRVQQSRVSAATYRRPTIIFFWMLFRMLPNIRKIVFKITFSVMSEKCEKFSRPDTDEFCENPGRSSLHCALSRELFSVRLTGKYQRFEHRHRSLVARTNEETNDGRCAQVSGGAIGVFGTRIWSGRRVHGGYWLCSNRTRRSRYSDWSGRERRLLTLRQQTMPRRWP